MARGLFLAGVLVTLGLVGDMGGMGVKAEDTDSGVEGGSRIPMPSWHYGARIEVSCLNRSM